MDPSYEIRQASACATPPRPGDELSRLEILSSVAKVDSLQDISSLEELSQNEPTVIELLNHYSRLSGEAPAVAQAAREVVVACRQSQLQCKAGKSELQGAASFDRLIYLLDRYLDYCRSINLIAWPIDHLKTSIWIKNDVTLTTNTTRMKPLRKTVRCYVTSLESIRLKTAHLFKDIHLGVHLMKSKIILEILNSLSVERDNLEERLGGCNGAGEHSSRDGEAQSERDLLIREIRSRSGDHYAKQAMDIVKASRGGEQGENAAKPRGKAADPHIHTLLRYRNYCFLNKIPMWPIDSARVALWLKESVLVGDPRNKSKKSTVSFRTVQVYLSRLEYARIKTEHLFEGFANYGGSLYKSSEIVEILSDLNNPAKVQCAVMGQEINHTATQVLIEYQDRDLVPRSSSQDTEDSFISSQTADKPFLAKRARLPSLFESLPSSHWTHRKKRKFSTTRNFSPRKMSKINTENASELSSAMDGKTICGLPRMALQDSNGRRTPSFRLEIGHTKLSRHANVSAGAVVSPTRANSGFLTIPSISEWYSPPSSPSKNKKGCISFILCSDEESDQSNATASSYEVLTPDGTPSHHATNNDVLTPSRLLDSPTCNRFWTHPLGGM
ncbi:hypothetical protein VP01_2970g3 [Puccinia sorghi]|uniref:Uncharacterized protein n=1 Tax=Puccinia sorghi TaxID=27349 RepID=A0A0L6V0S7_9BASI|nr:hypothetical protein VP01_2970g3 [Puccinia sorghi]